MKEIAMNAVPRSDFGKGAARQVRRDGKIPAIIYGPEIDPQSISVDEREFHAVMKSAGSSTIVNLKVADQENKVVLREIQRDPLSNKIVHVDFHAISMTKPLNIMIPIRFEGTPVGVKVDGGIMNAIMRELDISCLPTDIPDDFTVDVSELGIGDSIHVGDLEIPKVEILSEGRRTVVVISAPTVIKAATTAEGEEAEEGEAPAEGEEAAAEGEAAPAAGEGAKAEEKAEKKE